MTEKNFNRTYRVYQPGGAAAGPPTERICRPTTCFPNQDPDANAPFNNNGQKNNNQT